MTRIFPPKGDQDQTRARSLKREEREYIWFCLEFCEAILRRRSAHLESLELAANYYTQLGYYSDGLGIDRRLAELKPDDPGVLYNLACSYALTGRADEALETLEKAVDRGYRDFRHMSTDRDLAAIKGDPRFGKLLARAARSAM